MQLCNDAKSAIRSEQRIRTICGRLSVFFMIVSAISVALVLFYATATLPNSFHNAFSMIQFSYSIVQLICSTAIFWLLKMLFDTISRGENPLTKKHAIFLSAIGLLLLFSAGLDIISQVTSFSYSNVTVVNDVAEIGFVESKPSQIIHIDVKCLVASLFMFSIAAVFSYAAELQTEVSETI